MELTVDDLAELVDKLCKLEKAVNAVNVALDECESMLQKPVLSLGIRSNVKIRVGRVHNVKVDCTVGVDVYTDSIVRYTLTGSVLEPVKPLVLPRPQTIDLNKLTVRDILVLASYEKNDRFVTKLVEVAAEKDRELGKKLEVLKTVVDAVMPLVEMFQQ